MAVDLKSDNDTFKIHPEDESNYNTPTGEETMRALDSAIKEYLKSFEHIKTVQVEDDKIVKQEFHGDLGELSSDTEEEQYETLMNTFLNRKDRRKLSRYKGFKTFSDRFK